jgi:hypothetical protein
MKRLQKEAWNTLYEKLSVGFATLVNPPFLSCITTTMLVLSRESVLANETPVPVFLVFTDLGEFFFESWRMTQRREKQTTSEHGARDFSRPFFVVFS